MRQDIGKSAADIIESAKILLVADANRVIIKADELIKAADEEWTAGRVNIDEYIAIRATIGEYIAKGIERRCGWPGP